MATTSTSRIDPNTGHRIDTLTNIDIDQAINTGDEISLLKVEIAQYEHRITADPTDWYSKDSLKIARRRLARAEAKAASR